MSESLHRLKVNQVTVVKLVKYEQRKRLLASYKSAAHNYGKAVKELYPISLGGRLIEAQEHERREIARELHDNISQSLALLHLDLQQLRGKLVDSESASRLESITKRTLEVVADVHALSHRWHSSRLETLGLVANIKSFCSELSAQRSVQIDFTHAGVPDAVPYPVSLCLFRVLQEALSNAVKHSGATHCKARLERVSGKLQLTIRDPGLGFDVGTAMRKGGIGLISMMERVTLVNGAISIKSKPNRGTKITVRVPVAV